MLKSLHPIRQSSWLESLVAGLIAAVFVIGYLGYSTAGRSQEADLQQSTVQSAGEVVPLQAQSTQHPPQTLRLERLIDSGSTDRINARVSSLEERFRKNDKERLTKKLQSTLWYLQAFINELDRQQEQYGNSHGNLYARKRIAEVAEHLLMQSGWNGKVVGVVPAAQPKVTADKDEFDDLFGEP